MIPAVILDTVRRALLDFMDEVGGEQSDDTLALQLQAIGHRVARRDVAEQMRWLAAQGLIEVAELGPYLVGTVLPDGVDAAGGRLAIAGLGRHKTGRAPGSARP